MYSPLEQFDVILLTPWVFDLGKWSFEISVFHGVVVIYMISVLMVMWLTWIENASTLVPKTYQLIIEKLYTGIITLIKQQAGERGITYLPLVLTIFIFILTANLFSLLPYSFAITSHIINIIYLTITLISSLFLLGLINFGIKFLKLFVPESPFLLLFLLIPIELFSYTIRAFSMAIRLSANIMAGHTLVFIVSGFLIKLTTVFMLLTSVILLAIFFLEFGVALLQAYVFTVLFCIYLKESLYEPSH